VDVILSGPVSILSGLRPEDLRVVVDMTGRGLGIYQEALSQPLLPDRVNLESMLPETVEIEISLAPTPTPTSTPSPNPTATPAP
jgi:hypothetical protein